MNVCDVNWSQQSAATMSSTSGATKWSSAAAQDGVHNTKACCNEMTLPVLFKFSAYLEQTFDCRQSVCNKRTGKQMCGRRYKGVLDRQNGQPKNKPAFEDFFIKIQLMHSL